MKKVLLSLAFAVVLFGTYFVLSVRKSVATFENDYKASYKFTGFLGCKYPSNLSDQFAKLYVQSCEMREGQDLAKFIEALKPSMSKLIHSPLLKMRPFRAQNILLSQYTNSEYLKLKSFLLSYADTEISRAQVEQNFFEADCSDAKMKEYVAYAESVRNQFTRMYLMSEIKNCMFINNVEDQNLIQNLLSLAPLEIEDESTTVQLLKESVRSDNFILSLLPAALAETIGEAFIPKDLEEALKTLDLYFYYDELSQLFYIRRDFTESLKYADLAMNLKVKKFDVENFTILNYMTLARLGKISLQRGEKDKATLIIKELEKENAMFKYLPSDIYYIDMSLAELFLMAGEQKVVTEYLGAAHQSKLIPDHLFKKWNEEIGKNKTAKLDLDMFRFVNQKSIDAKIFKSEESQIIQFKDRLESPLKNLQ